MVLSASDFACLVMRHASFLLVSSLEEEQGWVRGGGRGGKILKEVLLRGFEGFFTGWGPGGGPQNDSLECWKTFLRSVPGTIDPF